MLRNELYRQFKTLTLAYIAEVEKLLSEPIERKTQFDLMMRNAINQALEKLRDILWWMET